MTEVEPYNQNSKTLNVNRYATKKTIAQGMLDIALLTANASQLKYVLQTSGKHPFYTLMITLISLSIALQVLSGLLALTVNAAQDCRLHILENPTCALALNQLQLISSFLVTGVTAGISILYIGTLNINKPQHCKRADLLNNAITTQIFLVSVINVLISAFGIEQVNQFNAEQLRNQQKMLGTSRLTAANRSTVLLFDDTKL